MKILSKVQSGVSIYVSAAITEMTISLHKSGSSCITISRIYQRNGCGSWIKNGCSGKYFRVAATNRISTAINLENVNGINCLFDTSIYVRAIFCFVV